MTDAIQHWQQGDLDVLLAGNSALPTELVQSKAMDDLLAKLRDRYDVILLDTPPLRAVSDAALLSTVSNGAIVVARYDHSGRGRHSLHGKPVGGQRAGARDGARRYPAVPPVQGSANRRDQGLMIAS